MNLRALPTGGNPVRLFDVIASLVPQEESTRFFDELFPGKVIFEVSSGSSALKLSLDAMKSQSSRTEVILPGYTCPSVLAAVINAGLKPVLCDLSPDSFFLNLNDLAQKAGTQTLAVVGVHLYGLTEDIAGIKEITKQKGIFILEDSAQAVFNAKQEGNAIPIQNQGDLCIYSFGRGKPFSLLSGGVVVINNQMLFENTKSLYKSIPEPSFGSRAIEPIKLMAYSALFHPRLFWIPQALPFLHIGETIFTLDMDHEKMLPLSKRLGRIMLKDINSILANRQSVAFQYAERLKDCKGQFAFFPPFQHRINLLRFPFIFEDSRKRDLCLAELSHRGLGASGGYPCPLNRMEGAKRYFSLDHKLPNADQTARRVMTLPLHRYVNSQDIEMISSIISTKLLS